MMAAIREHIVKPDNLLLENGMNVFHLIMPLISGDRGASTEQDLRAKLFHSFDSFEKRCYESQLDSSLVNDAKYAMAAFVDEKVMSSAWPHKLSWMGKPLQLEFFGDNLAGEGFFKKLTTLRQSGDRNIDVLEIYFLCLQLGFEGMYRMRGLEQLQALQVDLRTQIADSRNRVPRTLSPHGVASGSFMEKVQREVPYWVIALITVSIIFAAYLLFITLLGNKADSVREVLQDDGRRIQNNLERDAEKQLPAVVTPPLGEAPQHVPASQPKAEKKRSALRKVEAAPPPPQPETKPESEPAPEPKPKVFTPIMGF